MAFPTWLREKSYRLWDASRMQDRHKLLIFLREAYRNQSENMTNLTQPAEQMYYSHLRDAAGWKRHRWSTLCRGRNFTNGCNGEVFAMKGKEYDQ
jgi:hypothetical protein